VFENYLPTVTTKLLNGKSLTLTDTHEIITKHGKIMFKDLTSRDTVFYEDGSCGFIETENRKLPYLREKSIAAIQKANGEMIEYISRERLEKERTNISTLRSISTTLAVYQKIATSTTETAIHLTMIRAISCVLMVQSILERMLKSITKRTKGLSKKTLSAFAPLRRLGMRVMRGVRGILNMPERYFKIALPLPLSVSTVEHSVERNTTTRSSAPMHANQLIGGLRERTTKKGPASCAREFSRPTSTRKLRPVLKNAQIVYDIEVDEVHEYFANGLLVSNSIDSVRYMMDLHIRQQRKERRKKKKARALPTFNRWGR
jgi:hypothetical protein